MQFQQLADNVVSRIPTKSLIGRMLFNVLTAYARSVSRTFDVPRLPPLVQELMKYTATAGLLYIFPVTVYAIHRAIEAWQTRQLQSFAVSHPWLTSCAVSFAALFAAAYLVKWKRTDQWSYGVIELLFGLGLTIAGVNDAFGTSSAIKLLSFGSGVFVITRGLTNANEAYEKHIVATTQTDQSCEPSRVPARNGPDSLLN